MRRRRNIHLSHIDGELSGDCIEASIPAVNDPFGALARLWAAQRLRRSRGTRVCLSRGARALHRLLPQLDDPPPRQRVGGVASGEGRQGLVVENPGELAVARELVVLESQTLQPGKPRHQLAGQGGEVVGVEGEGDQLGQVGQGGGVQAPDLVVVQLEKEKMSCCCCQC